ncbi:hypothetical protein [uncultured Oceanicoccus sp.]|uniref:hypothetical protein n=1 Tax=uncultured Oceanicoccus sp. TaxID=1706381 RepID=UPI0030D88847
MTIDYGSLVIDNSSLSDSQLDDLRDTNQFAVKMAGQIRAMHKRRKLRAQRTRSRRR